MAGAKKRYWHKDEEGGCGRFQVRFFGIKIFEFDGVRRQFGLYFCLNCRELLVNVNLPGEEKCFRNLVQNSFSREFDFLGFQKRLQQELVRDRFISAEVYEGMRR